MLVQPYIENAILHGINPKAENGHITIRLGLVNQYIKISVIDNGVGREASKSLKSLHASTKHKSLGMKITKDRLRLLNSMQQSNLSVNITDIYNSEKKAVGTQVDLYIPYVK